MADDGVTRVLAVLTSAYSSYSGCRQYRENLAAAAAPLGERAPAVDRVRHYFNHPGFVEPMVESTWRRSASCRPSARRSARLVFVTHSIPLSMDASQRTGRWRATCAQHRDVAGWSRRRCAAIDRHRVRPTSSTAAAAARRTSRGWSRTSTTISRSSRPAGCRPWCWCRSASCPTTWRSCYDLDTEAMPRRRGLGLPCARAATVGTDPRFVAAVRELVLERAAVARGEVPTCDRSLGALGPSHDVCPLGCCPNRARTAPAAAVRPLTWACRQTGAVTDPRATLTRAARRRPGRGRAAAGRLIVDERPASAGSR